MNASEPQQTWLRGALEAVDRCPACGSAKRDARRYSRHDDGGVMPDVWHMVCCADCGSLYLDPRPDAESLPRAYLTYYTHQAESIDVPESGASGLAWRLIHGYLNRRFGMRRQPANALGFHLFSAIEPWRLKLDYYGRHLTRARAPVPGRLLDVGCGNGAFLVRAREMGWTVLGCEPDAAAVAACRGLGLDVVQGDVFHPAFDQQHFDVITMSHVIEHVADPSALLKRAHALLRPGGLLWAALPNPRSLGLRVFGAAWRGLHIPFHLCIPSQHQLILWIRSTEFCSVKMMRRGAHSRRLWADSTAIARCERITILPRLILSFTGVLVDFLSTFTPRFAEETVMIARKPGTGDLA